MPFTPAETRTAHDAIGKYRNAIANAAIAAKALADAASEARAAARQLQPYADGPIPAIAWEGAPPVGEWEAGLPALIAETKASLAA